jgi:hypothetical protein
MRSRGGGTCSSPPCPRRGAVVERSYDGWISFREDPCKSHLIVAVSNCLIADVDFWYKKHLKLLFGKPNQLTARFLFLYSGAGW